MSSTSLAFASLPGGALALFAAPALAQQYVVQELTGLSGFGTRAFEINDQGVAVGNGLNPSLQQHALVWPAGSGATDLTPTNPLAEAQGISASGLVAGWAQIAGKTQAIRWTAGAPSPLGMLAGHIGSFAQGVNDAGLVAGWSVTASGDPVAAVWPEGPGSIQAISGVQSWAFAVSETGDVAGHRWVGVDKEAFRWRAGTLTVLPHLGIAHTSAVGISPLGRIAGSTASPADGKLHGIVWEADNTLDDLGLFLDFFSTAATDANDAGVAVGGALNEEGEVFLALVWRGGEAEDLNTLIAPSSGWLLKEAQSVNARGEIAGTGLKGGSQATRAFLLQPDCDGDGLSDLTEIAAGTAHDANEDGQADECQHCQADLGFGGPGSLELSVCGDPLTSPASAATVRIAGAPASAPIVLGAGTAMNPTPFLGGVLVPVPPSVTVSLVAGPDGSVAFPIHGVATPQVAFFAQAGAVAGAELWISNAVRVDVGQP